MENPLDTLATALAGSAGFTPTATAALVAALASDPALRRLLDAAVRAEQK